MSECVLQDDAMRSEVCRMVAEHEKVLNHDTIGQPSLVSSVRDLQKSMKVIIRLGWVIIAFIGPGVITLIVGSLNGCSR